MKLMRFRWLYLSISLFFLIPGLISLVIHGLKPSIDFTGGSLIEVQSQHSALSRLENDDAKKWLNETYGVSSVQKSGENQYQFRGKEITNEQKDVLVIQLQEVVPDLQVIRFETVGPTLGRELMFKTLVAVLIVSTIITVYVWRQFNELRYGIAAILAMFHDSLILLGTFSLLGWVYGIEVDVLFVTALLTTLSFSVHDTIVVFDRIRELLKKHRTLLFIDLVDIAVLQTLSRSINNSMTIIIMLLALYLLGGETIRNFALALLIGSVTGTYSSTFVAAPLLLLWEDVRKKTKWKI